MYATRQVPSRKDQLPPYDPWWDTNKVWDDEFDWNGAQYPINKGPFRIGLGAERGGYDDCYYSREDDDERDGQEDDPGELICGETKGRCVDDKKGRSKHKISETGEDVGNLEWSPQVVCTIDGDLDAISEDELEDHPDPRCRDQEDCDPPRLAVGDATPEGVEEVEFKPGS